MATEYANGRLVTNGLVFSIDAADRNSYIGSGTSWKDLSGNANNGTLENGPTYSSDAGGNIVFDSTNENANFGDSSLFTPTSLGFSVEIWYYQPIPILGSGGYTFIDKWATGGNGEWIFGGSNSGLIYAWIYDISNGGFIGRIVASADSYSLVGRWNHAVWTYDGGTVDGSNKVYINSTQRDDTNLSFGGTFVSCVNGPTSVRVAYSNSALGNGLNGKVASVKIFNKALTINEIQKNYDVLKSRFGL